MATKKELEKDLDFLKSMKTKYKKCLTDVVSYEYLGQMIDDWIDEIKKRIRTKG